MFGADDKSVSELRDLIECLAAVDCSQAASLALQLDAALAAPKPDLTTVLLGVASSAIHHGLELGRTLTAACCRAFASRLGELYPGRSIEVRIPPWAAVQVGFGDGPTHRRGTPPNVVELPPEAFIALATGKLFWGEAPMQTSGAHAEQVAAAFPLPH